MATIRQAIADARARAQSDALGHRLDRFVNAPFHPVGRPDDAYLSGAGCTRCPARVTQTTRATGANYRHWQSDVTGPALTVPCTGVTRFCVAAGPIMQTVAFTASRSEAYIARWSTHWARQYPGRAHDVIRPTTGPLAGRQEA